MILLLSAWSNNNFLGPQIEWASVSLSNETIQKYLDRIDLARKVYEAEHSDFFCVEYWDGLPVWTGEVEVWNELYPESVQIVEHLQAGDEQGTFFGTSCTRLIVTHEGVSWETTLKSLPGTAGTEIVSKALLLELLLRQQALEHEGTGQANRYPERP